MWESYVYATAKCISFPVSQPFSQLYPMTSQSSSQHGFAQPSLHTPLSQDHLIAVHLLASNLLTTSTAENLNANHPIRRLLRPHTYGAVKINYVALKNLFPKRGMLHRAVSLTWGGLNEAMFKSFESVKSVLLQSLYSHTQSYPEDMLAPTLTHTHTLTTHSLTTDPLTRSLTHSLTHSDTHAHAYTFLFFCMHSFSRAGLVYSIVF